MSIRLGELAVRFGCELRGDPDTEVDRVATLSQAGAGAIAFLANSAYRRYLSSTNASAVLVTPDDAGECAAAAVVCANPYLVYAKVAAELHPSRPLSPGIHPGASVQDPESVPASCEIGPGAYVASGVRLGEGVSVGANVTVSTGAVVGDHSVLMPGVTVLEQVRIGARCILHSGVVVGSDGFGNARDDAGQWHKVPQIGGVVIGDDVEIGANTTIDRGAIGDTQIADGVRLDNLIQVGHNCVIGAHTAIAAMSGLSGSTIIGARCRIGGSVGFAGHIEIADDVVITGGSAVTHSIKKAGLYGGPAASADDARRWRRNAVRYTQLDEMAKRLRRLEKQLESAGSDD